MWAAPMTAPAMLAMESESPLLVDAHASASRPLSGARPRPDAVAMSATRSAIAVAEPDSHPSPIPMHGSP